MGRNAGLVFLELFCERGNLGQRPEKAGAEEVKERPEVREPVFNGRSGEGDPRFCAQAFHRFCLARSGVLNGLRLVEHKQGPAYRFKPGLPGGHAVGGENRVGARQVVGGKGAGRKRPERRVQKPDFKRRGESFYFRLPVCQKRCGKHQKRRPRLLLFQEQEQRKHLDGFAQAHVIGQACA